MVSGVRAVSTGMGQSDTLLRKPEHGFTLSPMSKGPVPAVVSESSERCSAALTIATDDATLVARVRSGDTAAYEELFRTYYPGLLRFATTLVGSDDDGEELVQDIFARVWSAHERWEVRDRFKTVGSGSGAAAAARRILEVLVFDVAHVSDR